MTSMARRTPRQARPRGMTLLEMLVVLALVALLGTLIAQGLGFFLARYDTVQRVARDAGQAGLQQHWFAFVRRRHGSVPSVGAPVQGRCGHLHGHHDPALGRGVRHAGARALDHRGRRRRKPRPLPGGRRAHQRRGIAVDRAAHAGPGRLPVRGCRRHMARCVAGARGRRADSADGSPGRSRRRRLACPFRPLPPNPSPTTASSDGPVRRIRTGRPRCGCSPASRSSPATSMASPRTASSERPRRGLRCSANWTAAAPRSPWSTCWRPTARTTGRSWSTTSSASSSSSTSSCRRRAMPRWRSPARPMRGLARSASRYRTRRAWSPSTRRTRRSLPRCSATWGCRPRM